MKIVGGKQTKYYSAKYLMDTREIIMGQRETQVQPPIQTRGHGKQELLACRHPVNICAVVPSSTTNGSVNYSQKSCRRSVQFKNIKVNRLKK